MQNHSVGMILSDRDYLDSPVDKHNNTEENPRKSDIESCSFSTFIPWL